MAAVAVCAVALHGTAALAQEALQVIRMIDGDTVWLAPDGRSDSKPRPRRGRDWTKIRIEGIDAPEICQPYGEASQRALRQRVLGRAVTVEVVGVDQYGRVLARLYLDGEDVGRQQVLAGQAWAYRQRWGDRGIYAMEEMRTMQAGRGLFADPKAEYPADFRRRAGSCHAPAGR